MSKQQFSVQFVPSGRGAARCPADPRYPNGKTLDLRADKNGDSCVYALPYPAPQCGLYIVTCSRCGWDGTITAAGRKDDPRTLSIGCRVADVA